MNAKLVFCSEVCTSTYTLSLCKQSIRIPYSLSGHEINIDTSQQKTRHSALLFPHRYLHILIKNFVSFKQGCAGGFFGRVKTVSDHSSVKTWTLDAVRCMETTALRSRCRKCANTYHFVTYLCDNDTRYIIYIITEWSTYFPTKIEKQQMISKYINAEEK